MHVSPRTLYAALSPEDEGIAAEIRRQRLDRARSMLLDTSDTRSIAEIGATVGLSNSAHFSRLFRARYGHSPSELRGANGVVLPAASFGVGDADAVESEVALGAVCGGVADPESDQDWVPGLGD